MKKFFTSLTLSLLIIPCFFFIFFVFTYESVSKTIPVSYWDEILWVGRSYFFENYIHRDFQNKSWQSYESYDQAKFAEYAYGAWLYPIYLNVKMQNKKIFDYTQFLIDNGFSELDDDTRQRYSQYIINSHIIRFDQNDEGFLKDYVAKYGSDSLKPISLVYVARMLNVLLLATAVILAYFFVLQHAGFIPAIVFSFFYGFNTLIIETGLKAHSEALFLVTFNASILCMTLYFTKGRRTLYMLFVSIFSGLCMSTKLNGSMLIIIFFILQSVFFIISKQTRVIQVVHSIAALLISLLIFMSLNPFTFTDPVRKTLFMFEWRIKVAAHQGNKHQNLYLSNSRVRIQKIFENFYSLKTRSYYNGVKIFEKSPTENTYIRYLIVFFVVGLLYSIKLAFNRNINAIVFICSFVIILFFMSRYLFIDWKRYYIHVSLFFIFCQSFGLWIVVKTSYKYLKLFIKRKKSQRTLFR